MVLSQLPQTWDKETDVVIVGAGNTGLPAAIEARDKGLDVILLELWGGGPASSLAMIAGGTVFAGTEFQKEKGIKDSPEELLEDALQVTKGDKELWKKLVERQLDTYEWLCNICGKPIDIISANGHNNVRVHRFDGHGVRILKKLRKTAEERGAQLLLKHRGERLYVDPTSGRVIGIRVKHENDTINIRAKKGIILASGGFIYNREYVKEFNPYSIACLSNSAPSHFGDGLRMAMDIGAATAELGAACAPSLSTCTETKRMTIMWNHGAICVNKDNERWCDEIGRPYNMMLKDVLVAYPDGLHYIIYDKKIRDVSPAVDYKQLKEYTADTLEEAAKLAGLDPDALKAEIDQYNSDLDQYGYDRKFGRKYWGGRMGMAQAPKIDTPPYYIMKCVISLTSCKGGVKINPNAQVIDLYGDPIPGLYAGGEVAGGLFGEPEAYYAGIMTLFGFVYGRIAAESVAAEAGV